MNCSICTKPFVGPPFSILPSDPGALPMSGSLITNFKGYQIGVHFRVTHFSTPALSGLAFCKDCLQEAAMKAFDGDSDLIIRGKI